MRLLSGGPVACMLGAEAPLSAIHRQADLKVHHRTGPLNASGSGTNPPVPVCAAALLTGSPSSCVRSTPDWIPSPSVTGGQRATHTHPVRRAPGGGSRGHRVAVGGALRLPAQLQAQPRPRNVPRRPQHSSGVSTHRRTGHWTVLTPPTVRDHTLGRPPQAIRASQPRREAALGPHVSREVRTRPSGGNHDNRSRSADM